MTIGPSAFNRIASRSGRSQEGPVGEVRAEVSARLEELRQERAHRADARREARGPILAWAAALREKEGDPALLTGIREETLVVVAALARDFGGRHLLGPFRIALAERWPVTRHEANEGIVEAQQEGYLRATPAVDEHGRPSGETILEVVGDLHIGGQQEPPAAA